MKYIITVTEHPLGATPGAATGQEVFKIAVEEFDALTFCAALKAKVRGRKPAKKGEQSP